jgi:ATP-dependent RNA helicase DHX37/DHR1
MQPLKVIIMSATLRVADFTENRALFPTGPPPLLSIPARQYPVRPHAAAGLGAR